MFERLRQHWGVLKESLQLDRERRRDYQPSAEPEFLPAALEILERPPSPVGRAVLWSLLAFLVLAILWAVLGKIDIVAVASGKIVPRGQVKIIQSSDNGVVRAIHVVEGQAVAKGAPLIELDPTVSAAEVEQARRALLTAEIDVARARALVNYITGKPFEFQAPATAPADLVDIQKALVQAKVHEYETATAALRQERRQRAGDLGMVGAEVAKLEEQLPLATEQLDKMELLSRDNYVPKLRVSEVKERVVGMRQDLAIRREEQRKAVAGEAAVVQQLAKQRSEFTREALDALTEAEAARGLRAEELKKAADKAQRTVLVAPEAGTVQQLQVHTLGGVVKPADPLLIIVPKGEELIVEAMVLNRDAGFVHEGQPVEIKLEAYPFTRYGVVAGRVEQIGRDAVEKEKQGLIYPTRIKLSHPWIEIGGAKIYLAPGLATDVEIKTGERRIIEYLLSPLARRVQEAGRER
ncbi:HlyD family type I secretion periplasmic adaptor subunit [Pseudoxanthomonas helianthi]|uniref:Membrane fusion protein (MFP) family protein n=1 Tax=Pseudoxanthomonas helianthi TaxID=1453541 RepID=A0A940X3U8_9GAMM|nr:HlyD family type I secretion periplasmic adaptor subunit [Pseudoxanthomonas helianthi]MBP3984551.1 HlyD family type I secretion periplasmic adaptor subunit [Pseudoxanthomonas helianthi]